MYYPYKSRLRLLTPRTSRNR